MKITTFYKILILCFLVNLPKIAVAQEEENEKTFDLSGSIDTYFRYNFSENQSQAPSTSFANQAGFAIGMANLIAS